MGPLAMINYEDEILVRIWLNGCGHAAGTIRTLHTAGTGVAEDAVTTYISWWPGIDRNKHSTPIRGFQRGTPNPHQSYIVDKIAETGPGTQRRFREGQPGFQPRGTQVIVDNPNAAAGNADDLADNPLLRQMVVTRPAHTLNLPALGTVARYGHQKHGNFVNKAVGPKDVTIARKMAAGEKLVGGQHAFWGLNLTGMVAWWTDFLTDPKNAYQYVSTTSNCAGVMTTALIAASAGAYTEIKSAALYRTPAQVRDLAMALESKLDTLNLATWNFAQDYAVRIAAEPGPDLSDLATFQRESSSPRFGFRREQIGRMDAGLKAYHRLGAWTSENISRKLKCLVTMMENALDHLRKKPTSVRRPGVETLGCQIVRMLSEPTSPLNVVLDRPGIGHICVIANMLRENIFPSTAAAGVKAKNRT